MGQRQGFGLRGMMSAAVLLAAGLPAAGADWLFPASSQFYDIGGNWSTGTAPGAGEAANFLGGNIGLIAWDDFTGSTTSASVLVDEAEVTFLNTSNASNPYTHTTVGGFMVRNGGVARLGNVMFEPMFLDIGDNLDLQGTAHFNASFGSGVSVGDSLLVGSSAGETASVTINGAGTMLSVSGVTSLGFGGATGILSFINGATGNLMGEVLLGDDSTANTAGVFNVTAGSVVTTGDFYAGDLGNPGVTGTILVDGAGSRITQTGGSTFTLGAGSLSTGMLTVSDGGRFEAGTGTALIDVTGSLNLDTGGVFVGRDVQLAGTATINDGVLFADHLQLNGGSLITGINSVVTVNTMSGFGNSVTLNGYVTFGEPAGSAVASHTVSGGQTFNVGRALVVGGNRQATFTVSGGEVTADALRIADLTSADGSQVDVTSNGTLTVANHADIGSAAGGDGTLTVSAGGSAEFGGTLRVYANGFVSVGSTATLLAHTIDTPGGGAFSAAMGSTVGFNNLTGFGNSIAFGGDVRTGVAVGPGGGFHTVQAGQTFTVGGEMKVGSDSGAAATQFNVEGGTLNVASYLDISSDLSGAGRDATFRVLNGGTVTNAGGLASEYGSVGGAAATIFVDGAGSRWDVSSARLNRGNLTLSNGGTYHATGGFTVNTQGVVNINSGGTFDIDGNLTLTGGTLNRADGGTLDLAANRTLTASNNAQINITGGYDIYGGRTFSISSGSDFAINTGGSHFAVGYGGEGALTADGDGSTLTLNTGGGFHDLAGDGATGTLTVRNNATATSNSNLLAIARSNATADTHGTLNIESGGQFTLNSIRVGDFDGNLGTGTINVTGPGSALTQNGSSSLILGNNAGTGSHTLNITDGATFTAGTGQVSVRTSGTVNLNSGGTLIANVINHTSGGTFNFGDGNLTVNTFNGNLVNNGGTLRPGGTPGDADALGTTTIHGNYTQNADATLALQFRYSDTPGTSYDSLDVNGHFEMAGTLSFDISPAGATIIVGARYDILDWDTRSGTFDQFLLFDLGDFHSWNTQDLYTTGEISVERPGDLNTDGFVGVEDLDLLLAHWGETTHSYNFAGGDLSGDGVAGQADLDLIIAHWGNGTPPGNVPEPGSLALFGLTGLALLKRRR